MANLPENKSSKVLRVFLSFVLFFLIVLVNMSVCSKAVFLNKNDIEDRFTGYEYVSSVKNSVLEYTMDIYTMNGLDSSSLASVFDDEAVREAVKAYIAGNIGSSPGYNEDTYFESVRKICDLLETDLTHQIQEKGLKNDTQSIKNISQSVNDYFVDELDISHPKAKTMINTGAVASVVVMCIGLFFVISVGLTLFFIGTKRYRSVRAIGISFYTAGLFEILISVMACVVFEIKHIDIFPVYLRELVMNYIYHCISSVAVSGCFLLFIGLIISVIVWKMRRRNN